MDVCHDHLVDDGQAAFALFTWCAGFDLRFLEVRSIADQGGSARSGLADQGREEEKGHEVFSLRTDWLQKGWENFTMIISQIVTSRSGI